MTLVRGNLLSNMTMQIKVEGQHAAHNRHNTLYMYHVIYILITLFNRCVFGIRLLGVRNT